MAAPEHPHSRGQATFPAVEEVSCARMLAAELARLESTFGRLVYLAGHRDPRLGRYQHHVLSRLFPEDDIHDAFRRSHIVAFCEWLCLPLDRQQADIEGYFAASGVRFRGTLLLWIRNGLCEDLIPPEAFAAERELFLSDLEKILL